MVGNGRIEREDIEDRSRNEEGAGGGEYEGSQEGQRINEVSR